MYWRVSRLDAGNNQIEESGLTFELYIDNDDYACFLKPNEDEGSPYKWFIMQPCGTRYGSQIMARFKTFTEAYRKLPEYI